MYDLIIKIAAVTERDWITMTVSERLEWISAMHKELSELTDRISSTMEGRSVNNDLGNKCS